MLDKAWFWFALVVVMVAAVCLLFAQVAPPQPFAYDESDYMYAGTQGVWANFTDRHSMSFYDFVVKGLETARDKSKRSDLSQYVRSLGDISFYRHYHGPVYAYWIGLGKLFGITSESGYRGSGLVLHALGTIAVFWLFLWTFPELPKVSAFIASAALAMNRTALVTALTITQHIAYEFLCILALFAAAKYFKSGDRRWWYATTALLGGAFATVELGIILVGAVLISLVLLEWKQGWKHLLGMIGRGSLAFLGAVLILWPKGLLQLNALKGYLYLGYMAIYRKTFSPITPAQMWGAKFRDFPLEFVLPAVALVGMILFYRKLKARQAVVPFLVYTCLFVAVTMVVTAPYTHYHGSLMASAAVVTGVAFGEFWKRVGAPPRVLALTLTLASLVALDVSYFKDLRENQTEPSLAADILAYLSQHPPGAAPPERVFINFFYVPTLNYYRPAVMATGYDDWSAQRLAEEAQGARQARIFCSTSLCRQLEAVLPAGSLRNHEIVSAPEKPGYSLEIPGKPSGEALEVFSLVTP
jgi:hypothetical protein